MSDTRIEPTFDPSGPPGGAGPQAPEATPAPTGADASQPRPQPQAQPQSELQPEPQPQPQPESQAQPQPAPEADLQAQLQALQAKVNELTEQYLRAQAEAQNTRRRAEDEMAKTRKFAVESFAESLLPVADSLEAGLAIAHATPEQIREGAETTLRQLKTALERNKVIEINPPVGAKFDPHQHQAISVVPAPPDSRQEANTVVTVLQKGYLIAERVLRPALVTVAAAPPDAA